MVFHQVRVWQQSQREDDWPHVQGRRAWGSHSPGRCTAGSWALHRALPCRRPGTRCTALAKTRNPPRIPGGSRENAKSIILFCKDPQVVLNIHISRDHIWFVTLLNEQSEPWESSNLTGLWYKVQAINTGKLSHKSNLILNILYRQSHLTSPYPRNSLSLRVIAAKQQLLDSP